MTEFFLLKASVIIFSILGAALAINTARIVKELIARVRLMHSVNARGRRAMSRC